MTEELGSIGVGLKVGLGSLDRDVAAIEKKVKSVAREWPITFKVGSVNVAEVQREIKRITQGKVNINVTPTISAGAGRKLKSEIEAQLKAAGPVKVQVVADVSGSQSRAVKQQVETALKQGKPVAVPVQPQPVRAAPAPPTVASSPTAAPAALAARAARTAAPPAATPPRYADLGGLPTGPATGVTYRTSPSGEVSTARGRTTGTAAYLQRKTDARTRSVSPDTLRRDKARANLPGTPEEIEYASRQAQVRVPMSGAEADLASEGRRGVRGARRSGARERNEPFLTAAEREAQGIIAEDIEAANATARGSALRSPARRSRAFYGSREGVGRLGPIMSKLQFYKFDPVLGMAFEALEEGELGEARGLLQGFSSKLAGADPRQRKKFFRLFRNVENVPPELLEKDAALRALFAEIHSRIDPDMVLKNAGKRREGGGRVMEGPLSRRLREARDRKYLVGEKRPETYISDSGRIEIVGEHGPEIRTFDEPGKIEPRVPEWIRRGLAKDLTGHQRATGGPVRGVGGARFRSFVAGEKEAIAGGLLGRADSGSVQRVFVVNWPAGAAAFMSAPGGAVRAAGPMRFGTEDEARKFAKELGGHLGREMKELLGETEVVKPKDSTPETVRPGPVTAEERVGAKLEAIFGEDPRALRSRLTEIRAGLSETQAYAPVRSLAPAVGQQVATLFGRGELLRRLAIARDLTAQATRAEGVYNAEVERTIKIQKQLDATQDPAARAQLVEDLKGQTDATKSARVAATGLADEALGAAKSADALSLKLGTLIGNTTGIIGGTLLFGATLGVAQAGLSAVSQVLSPLIERAAGFRNISAEVTKQLGEQVRTQQGAVQSTIAQREAQAGLSSEVAASISPLLQQRAIIEGGNAAFADQLDLLHTAQNLRREEAAGRAGFATGPFQPPGGVPGITRATGGAFGTPLGATPSLFEQVAGEAGQQPIQQIVRGLSEALFGQGPTDLTSLLGANPVLSPDEITKVVQNELANGGDVSKIGAAVAPALQLADSLEAMGTGLDKVNSEFEIIGQTSERFNEQLHQASNFQLALNGVSKEVIDSFDKLGGIAVVRRGTSEPISNREEFKQAFEDVLRSATIPDPKLLIKQLTDRIIPAARDQFAAEGRLQRTTSRGQFALQELAQPTPGLGGIPFEQGLVGRGDNIAKRAAATYKTEIGGAVSFVNEQIEAGRQTLIDLVPANLRGEFTDLLGDITATGQQITKIQTGIQQQQVNLQVAEYNNQLRIARRSLQDARDIQAGLAGETRNTLGGIEGQNIALQRQLQLLGFELAQRQINFRLATAGFVAPGTTPEERAARIEAAKIEANFAQKQLDLQKQIAANQFRGVQITVSRDVTDLLAQINLLQQGREVTVNTAAAARALDILNKKQQLLLAQAGTYIEEGVKITQAAIQAAAEVRRQTGAGFAYLLSQTANAWGIFGEQARAILTALTGTAPRPPNSSGSPDDRQGLASGIIGDTLGPTNVTIGEAGREKVAILKNPRLVPSSSFGLASGGSYGGPLVSMTVIISGNQIRSEQDTTELAEKVYQKVERRFMEKTSLFVPFRR